MGFFKDSIKYSSPVGFIAVTVAEEAFTTVDKIAEEVEAAEAVVAVVAEAAGKKNGWPQQQKQERK